MLFWFLDEQSSYNKSMAARNGGFENVNESRVFRHRIAPSNINKNQHWPDAGLREVSRVTG